MFLTTFLAARYGRCFPTRAAIENHHARAFERFRRKVMPRSPFYRDLARTPLAALPRMDKASLMRNFTAINTCGLDYDQALAVALRAERTRDFKPLIGKVSVGLSTGTSGQRGLFLTTPRERAQWAAVMLGRFWPRLWQRQRVAFFMRADNALYRSISNPMIRFEFFDMMTPWEDHLPRLDALNPTALIAPARILGQLARSGLRIAPQRVVSIAETLMPDERTTISVSFGCPVDEVYQATEGVLAMTCRAGNLHLNEHWLRIDRDVIDPVTGAFCPIIHDFTRESLPILNYRLNDVLIPAAEPCPCGCASQRIARIEGREDDMLWWPGGSGLRLIPADAIRNMIACLPLELQDWRAIQRGDVLEIWLEGAERDARPDLERALADLGRRLNCTPPRLELRQGLPAEVGAKRRRVRVEAG